VCGDGFKGDYEECDDGNLVDGDGCDSTCKVEDDYICFGGSFGGPDTCRPLCNDKIVETIECDDSNDIDLDGCDGLCRIETGWTCTGNPSACEEICGDGIRVGSEVCDDGNTDNGDGCNNDCT